MQIISEMNRSGLYNYFGTLSNSKMEKSFIWSVRNGLGVDLSILFDTFTLERKYPGVMGLVRFLHSLDKGKLQFRASAFPEHGKELERSGVERITAHFEVHDPLGATGLEPEFPSPPAEAIKFPLSGDEMSPEQSD